MRFDLYRLYFPLGWLIGLWGAFVWVLFKFSLIAYPGAIHPEIMIGGFLLPFILGFLMTAIPKLTSSFGPQKTDYIASFLISTNLLMAVVSSSPFYFRISSLISVLFLLFFIGTRFKARKSTLPNAFVFILLGIIMELFASSIFILSEKFQFSSQIESLARLLYFQGFVMCFIIGVGSRIIPSIFGHMVQNNGVLKEASKKSYLFLVLLFFLTYFVEVFYSPFIGANFRSLILLMIFTIEWKIFESPKNKSYMTIGLWIATWAILLGHTLANYFVEYYIHFIHLYYISGISLLTFLIASRVSLSHSGIGLEIEKKSKKYIVLNSCIVLAALTRVVAGFVPSIYFDHLFYAASVWIFVVIFWGSFIFTKILDSFRIQPRG